MLVKLCGFSEVNSLKSAIEQGCDFIGFIFYDKSVRNVAISKAIEISKIIPQAISRVAVVSDAKDEFLEEIATKFKPNYIQFHGNETLEKISQFKEKFPHIKIIKAFRVRSKNDLAEIDAFERVADLFLFDSKSDGEMGGSGKSFDWSLLKELKTNKKWFLSGGLNIDNIFDAINKTGAEMIDISSAIEEQKGVKSSRLITELMYKIKEEC